MTLVVPLIYPGKVTEIFATQSVRGFKGSGCLTILIPAFHGHGQVPCLYLAAVDWECGVLPSETGDDVGSSSDGPQENVCLDLGVNVVIALRFEGRASGENGVEGGERVGLARSDSSLLQGCQPPCPGTQNCHPACNKTRPHISSVSYQLSTYLKQVGTLWCM